MNYQESLLLTGDAWNYLSDEKKIEVLQTIENHMAFEANRMSVPVEGKFLHTGSDGIVLGSYDTDARRIYINTSQFDQNSMYGKDSSSLVTTCLHEGRHAYQHQVANGLVHHDDPNESEAWRENLRDGNYISFRENPRGYYEQPVEVDAREFATKRYEELVNERMQAEMHQPNSFSHAKNTFEAQFNNVKEEINCAANYQQKQNKIELHNHNEMVETDGYHQ